MPIPVDYRTLTYKSNLVADSGKYLGRNVYWKLYVFENIIRTIIHSVLTVQIAPNWWFFVADKKLKDKVNFIKMDYASNPRHTKPGNHEIYYIFLKDLNRIIFLNLGLFRPIVPDIDQWVVQIENIRLPRNVIGHMNWLGKSDKIEIDIAYKKAKSLVRKFLKTGFTIIAP